MKRILIIEDDLAIQKAMKITLEQNHYSVKAESEIGRASCRERV